MAKKSNFIKNLLTTASAVAVIAGGASSAYAAAGDGFSRPATSPARVNNAADYSGDNGGGKQYNGGYNIINSRTDAAGGADFTVDAAGDFGSFDVYGHNGNTITLNGGNLSLGVVYNSAAGSAAQKAASLGAVTDINAANTNPGNSVNARVGVKITGAEVLTLTGKAAVVNGGANPANMGAVVDLYTSLGVIDFNGAAGKLVANSANNGAIILKGATVANASANGNLELTTDLTVDDASFATIKNIKIAAGKALTFNVDADIENVAGATYDFADNAAKIVFNVDGDKTLTLKSNLQHNAVADLNGNVEFNSKAGNLLTVTGDIARTIGEANNRRLTQIEFKGDGSTTLDDKVTVFAKNILHSGKGLVTITNAADTGANSLIHVNGAGNLILTNGVTNAAEAKVDNGGTLTLSADSTITTTNITKGILDAANAVLTGNLNLGSAGNDVNATVQEITGNTKVEHGATLTVADKITGTLNVATGARVNAGNANVTANVTVGNNANNVLVINDITGGNLVADGGETTVRHIAGNATLDNAAIVNVSGDINGALDLAANTGFVNFSGNGTVAGIVGNTAAITKITVAGETTFANVGFKVAELNFAGDNAKAIFSNTVDFAAANMAKVTLSKDSKDNIIQINKNADITIDGEINRNGDVNALTFLYTNADAKTLTVDTADFRASVKSNNNKVLNLNFGANTAGIVGNLGEKNNLLNDVTFKSPNKLSVGDIYATNIVINDASQATFRGIVSSDSLKLGSANAGGAVARFAAGAVISSPITTNVAGKNSAHFEGGVEINKAITDLERVIFSDNESKALLNANITVGTVLARETELVANNNNVKISSATTAKSVGAKAGKTLIFNNNGVAGVTALTLENDVIISTEINGTNAGKVVVEGGSLDIDGMKSAKIIVDNTNSKVALETTIPVFDKEGGGVDLTTKFTNIEVEQKYVNNSLVKWVATSDANKVYLTSKDNSAVAANNLIGADATDKLNFQALAKDPGIFKEMDEMKDSPQSRTELVQRMDPTDATAVVSDITTGVSAGLGSRISNLVAGQSSSVQNKVVASNGTTGLSSGDDEARYGVWISPFFNQSVQKSNKGSAGYDASTGGGSFGFDTKANDDMVVGLALSMIHSDIKYKNYKSGDKNKINSAMFSVYGMQQITDNWFAQGLVTVGTNKVTTNEKRKTGNTTYQNATGTYNSMSFSGEALVGYNYSMNDFSITPMGGLRLTRVNDDGYTETGTTNQNLSITKKALSKAEIVVGTRVAGPAYDLNGVSVTPEVHGFLNQDMVGKNAKVDIKTSNGVQIADKSSKPNKTSFNVGAGLDAKYSYMEYGIAYDANISKKFMSNQGTIKVRLNF